MEETMGQRLREARGRALLTQKQLALKAGLQVMTVSRWERDEVKQPHPDTVRALAKALGVKPAWLRYGDG